MAATRKRTRKPRADEMEAETEASALPGSPHTEHDDPLGDALLDLHATASRARLLWHEASAKQRRAYAARLSEIFALVRGIPQGDVPNEARVGFDPQRTGGDAPEWPEAKR